MRTISFLLLFWVLLGSSAAEETMVPLAVSRVDPPNWWAGMQRSRVALLLYGESLRDVQAQANSPGLRVTRVDDLDSESYALVEIEVADSIEPGDHPITIARGGAEVTFGFPVHARENAALAHRGFSNDDVVYLITPDRFANGDPTNDHVEGLPYDTDRTDPGKRHGGDLQGIFDHLGYIRELGATAVWLNPVLENRGRSSYHGYAATDLYRVDPRFGDVGTYKRFVDEAHRRGLKVVFDHVNNHVGVGHPWVQRPPSSDWFNGTRGRHLLDKHYLIAEGDPHADPRSSDLLKTFWFVGSMPDLNCANRDVSDYHIQNTLWWIETTGFDGIREDTYPYADQEHLARWSRAIFDEYPEFNLVGEVWDTAPAVVALKQKGQRLPGSVETELPALMDFPLMEAFRRFVRGDGRLHDVYKVLAQDFLYADPSNLMTFVDNHDTPRIAYLSQDPRRIRLALTLLMTTRGIPQLLYGTELGMVGGPRHVDLRADFPGGFPGDERSAFTEAGRTPDEQSMYAFVQSLLRLRAESPALRRGSLTQYPVGLSRDVYFYLREQGEQRFLIVANGEDRPRRIDLSEVRGVSVGTKLVDALSGAAVMVDGDFTIPAGALSATVYRAP